MTALATTRDLGPAPEPALARDLVKRGLLLSPLVLGLAAVGWGMSGIASAGYAVALVLANIVAAAWTLSTAARISYALLMAAALFGFLVRLGLVSAAVLLVRDAAWVEPVALGLTLVVSHLGLLFWELRFVSISLAHPGLHPTSKETSSR